MFSLNIKYQLNCLSQIVSLYFLYCQYNIVNKTNEKKNEYAMHIMHVFILNKKEISISNFIII